MEQIPRTFGGKVVASIPISRMNHDEARAIRDCFTERGARRAEARRILAEQHHLELATCSRCFGGIREEFVLP